MRTAIKTRETAETNIKVEINLDKNSENKITTGYNFLDHMLREFALHSGYSLCVEAFSKDYDSHHLVEDIAITLGDAFYSALGDKKGIKRYGNMNLPMDEALIMSVVDISGRSYLNFDVDIKEEKVSDFETVLLFHFWESFVKSAKITLHIKKMYGNDPHHIIEAVFKSVARALSSASAIDIEKKDIIPSTKGIL